MINKMSLNDEEVSRLSEILGVLGESRAHFNAKSRSFIDDMISRYDELGPEIHVSPAQWNWLESLFEQI